MNHQEFIKAGNYWLEIDKTMSQMPKAELYQAMLAYIQSNDTCALATCLNNVPRVTPIEYIFHENTFYLFTEGGEKFFALENNPNVSVGIFDKFSGFNHLKSIQIQGKATLIDLKDPAYTTLAKVKKLNLEALAKRNHVLHLIAIKPTTATILNSDFKQQGYHVRQHYTWSENE